MRAKKQEEIKRICLMKVFAWNIKARLKCKECIYCVGGRCTYEAEREQGGGKRDEF